MRSELIDILLSICIGSGCGICALTIYLKDVDRLKMIGFFILSLLFVLGAKIHFDKKIDEQTILLERISVTLEKGEKENVGNTVE